MSSSRSEAKSEIKNETKSSCSTQAILNIFTLGSSAVFSLFGAFRNNKYSNSLGNVMDEMNQQAMSSTVVNEVSSVKEGLYTDSRILGIGINAVWGLQLLPYLVESIRHTAEGSLASGKFLYENWDYVIGRLCQATGLGLLGKGIHEDGQHSPQQAIGYTTGALLSESLGTFLVLRNKQRKQQLENVEPQSQLPDPEAPLLNSSRASSLNA